MPERALLQKYVQSGAFTDCFSTMASRPVTLAEFVTAFYTSWLFRLERLILRWAVSRPSSDAQALQVASGEIDRFAAWSVEARADDQLLMCDFRGRTRSWFMVAGARLYFGSAVVPEHGPGTGKDALAPSFKALLGLHRLYSRALLTCAKSRLQ